MTDVPETPSRANDRTRTGDVQLGKLIEEGPEDCSSTTTTAVGCTQPPGVLTRPSTCSRHRGEPTRPGNTRTARARSSVTSAAPRPARPATFTPQGSERSTAGQEPGLATRSRHRGAIVVGVKVSGDEAHLVLGRYAEVDRVVVSVAPFAREAQALARVDRLRRGVPGHRRGAPSRAISPALRRRCRRRRSGERSSPSRDGADGWRSCTRLMSAGARHSPVSDALPCAGMLMFSEPTVNDCAWCFTLPGRAGMRLNTACVVIGASV